MSITVNQNPSVLSPVLNELMVLVTSSNTAQPNYRYIFQVRTPSDGQIAKVKLPPRPSDNRGLLDVSRILQSVLTPYLPVDSIASVFKPATDAVAPNTNQITFYSVLLGEEYGTTASGVVEYLGINSISGLVTWYGGVKWLDFVPFDYNNYILKKTIPGHPFLSNAPLTQDIMLGQNYYLFMMVSWADSATAVTDARIKKYDSGGNLLASVTITNTYAQSFGMFVFPCGPANINAAIGGYIDSSVAYYTVEIKDSGGVTVSNILTFNMTTQCRYPVRRLHWLNQLGGYDAFNFTMKSRDNETLERANYRRRVGNTSGTTWAYSTNERGQTQFDTRTQRGFTLNTDWLTDAQSTWLEELFASPNVFMEFNGSIVAMSLTNPEYETKNVNNDKLFQWTLEVEFAHENIRQRQ